MTAIKRADAGDAVAGLFSRTSATGGLARREPPTPAQSRTAAVSASRLRVGVELTDGEVDYLRSLSRPARTGQPRTLGTKFVATGVLVAAIELLRAGTIDMDGVEAGDLAEMTARAKAALLQATEREAR